MKLSKCDLQLLADKTAREILYFSPNGHGNNWKSLKVHTLRLLEIIEEVEKL